MDNFETDATKKMVEIELKTKQAFLNEIEEEFAKNYLEENQEKKLIDLGTMMMKKISNEIIEEYCSNFMQKVNIFVSNVKELKINDIIKKVKTVILVAFVASATAAAALFIPQLSSKVAYISGLVASASGGLSAWFYAWFSSPKKTDSSKKLSFRLIPPEKFVKGKIKFDLCIGQVTYPLGIPDN